MPRFYLAITSRLSLGYQMGLDETGRGPYFRDSTSAVKKEKLKIGL
jgi:hypothetical protein